jgi:acetyl esterase/lipase
MNPVTRVLLALFLLVLPGSVTRAQTFVKPLWSGPIPGRIINPNYRPGTEYIAGGAVRLIRIVDPMIEAFLLPEGDSLRPAVIVCPGGGYHRLADDHEGTQIAKWLNAAGVSAFVLQYRLPSDSIMVDKTIGPLQDAQEAIRTVRRNARAWGIDPERVGVMGFSAGGHLAASVSTRYMEHVYNSVDSTSARPDFSILIYPVISMDTTIGHSGSRRNLLGPHPPEREVIRASNERQVTRSTPPAFLVHSWDDGTVPPVNSIVYARELASRGIPVELHLYETGGHGYGLGRSGGTETSWPDACIRWMKARRIL